VEAFGEVDHSYLPELIENMFGAGLSIDLIHCLRAIAECVSEQRSVIEDRLFSEVSISLTGTSAGAFCNPFFPLHNFQGCTSAPSHYFVNDDQDVNRSAKKDTSLLPKDTIGEFTRLRIQ
jgi:hypothetical protein